MRRFLLAMLGMLAICSQLLAQNRTISGRVTDEHGNTVPNATVSIKGTTLGTSTLNDGTFTISVPPSARTLVVTSVGLGDAEVTLNRSGNYNVVLSTTAKNLQEVVVVGYGTQRRTNVTGSVATVKAGDVENKPFTSVDKALQGTVAGLQSTSVSGAPGAATDIRIRGLGSITASNQPLWVIDGVIATTGDLTQNTTTANILSTLNPDDIESITVLKDAASASIYGSRASNGVIIVTTKKGRGGKTNVNFSTELGSNKIAYKNDKNRPMTTSEYQTVLEQALINAGYASDNASADAIITDPVNGFGLDPKTNTNWYNLVTHTGTQQQYNLSLNGGNDKTQFYASGGYFKQLGTTIATDFERYNGDLSITHKATDRLTFSATINGAATKQHTPNNGGAFANPVLASYFLLPWYSPYNSDGSFKYNDAGGQFPVNGGIFNPLIQAAWNKNTSNQEAFRGNAMAEYRILDNLKLTSRFSSELLEVSEDSYRNPFYGDGYAAGGDAFSAYRRTFDYTWSSFADWRQRINHADDIYFDLKAGYEVQETKNYFLQAGGQGFPGTLLLTYLASAATPTTAYAIPTNETTLSMFSAGDINFKNRYVISASFRRDGSSVFGTNHRFGNFYSVGGSWNINEENFFKDLSAFSLLKARASYGLNGNSNFSYYTALPTYRYDANYTGQPGSEQNNIGNSNLTWEKNGIFDVGIDFGILKNRITGTVDYYNRKTTDLILPVPLSLTSGFSVQNQNVGSMVNKGYEISLSGKPVASKSFSWDISFNISHNQNRVTELYKGSPVPFGTPSALFNATVGHDAQAFYTRIWAGVNPANGDPLWYTDGTRTKTTNSYSAAKLALVGQADPTYFGALTNTFSYKGVSLSIQFYYNYGNEIYDIFDSYLNSDGIYYGAFNQMSSQLTAWKKPGDVTNVPKIIYGGNKNSYRGSSRYLYNGDYIRLRDLELSYLLPKSVIKRLHMSNLTVYARGTNLWTWVKDKRLPFDPEAGANGQSEFDVYIPKSITGGIKIGF